MSKIAVVTGAGSGVGRAVVQMLAQREWDVALVGTRKETLDETIKLAGKVKTKLLACPCDVSSVEAVRAMAETVKKQLGDPEVLVCSAGTNVKKRSLAELSPEDYLQVINVNLNGIFFCVNQFLPGMRAMKKGTIVHIISDAGKKANAKAGAAYVASKFGLRGFSDTINVEERGNGIRSCALCPGEINTPILDKRPAPPPQEYREKILQAEDVAMCVMLAIELPPRAVLEELLVRPA